MNGVADQIKSKINMNLLKEICKKRYGIETIKNFKHKNANIVVIENQVACKLDFEVCFPMSIFITTKENSNSTLEENDYIPEELDDIPEELDDMPEELDALPEDLDDTPEEIEEILEVDFDDVSEKLDDIPDELEIPDELDDILEENLGVKDKVQPLLVKDTRNRKNSS